MIRKLTKNTKSKITITTEMIVEQILQCDGNAGDKFQSLLTIEDTDRVPYSDAPKHLQRNMHTRWQSLTCLQQAEPRTSPLHTKINKNAQLLISYLMSKHLTKSTSRESIAPLTLNNSSCFHTSRALSYPNRTAWRYRIWWAWREQKIQLKNIPKTHTKVERVRFQIQIHWWRKALQFLYTFQFETE